MKCRGRESDPLTREPHVYRQVRAGEGGDRGREGLFEGRESCRMPVSPTCTGKYEQARVVTGVERVCSGAANLPHDPLEPCVADYEQAGEVRGRGRGP